MDSSKTFSNGLGITVNPNTTTFAIALEKLDRHYDVYKSAVDKFRLNNNWTRIAELSDAFQRILENDPVRFSAPAN
ncbi:MAG TPA: hypothetical protein VH500_16380 [Nitrososphaeraceae archaeon]|jgi:hypothetical protein